MTSRACRDLDPAHPRRAAHRIEYAIRQRLLTYNVMRDVDRPRRDPKRMRVWTAHQLGAFLPHTAGDRRFPLLRLASHTGARRSELLGLRWADLDLEAHTMSVPSRRTRVGYTMVDRAGTKTTAGSRVIDLDPDTVAALKRWREVQTSERSPWGDAYLASGYVFTAENGEPLLADGGGWFAVDFDSAVTAADLDLTCDACGWSKTIAAGEWQTR